MHSTVFAKSKQLLQQLSSAPSQAWIAPIFLKQLFKLLSLAEQSNKAFAMEAAVLPLTEALLIM
jgi:hypothetical protein